MTQSKHETFGWKVKSDTGWKVSKYGVFSGIFPYSCWIRRFTPKISVFSPNAGKYGAEKTLYLHTFHAVSVLGRVTKFYYLNLSSCDWRRRLLVELLNTCCTSHKIHRAVVEIEDLCWLIWGQHITQIVLEKELEKQVLSMWIIRWKELF